VLAGRAAAASVTVQALCEVFSVLTTKRKWSHLDARAVSVRFSEEFRVIEPALSDVLQAAQLCDEHKISFWDALMICVAARGGCTSLITEDLQDGRRFSAADAGRSVRIVNPFDDANLEKLEAEGLNA